MPSECQRVCARSGLTFLKLDQQTTKGSSYYDGQANDFRNSALHKMSDFFRDGYSKSGIYCALSICCEQLHSEKEVDIFNAVRIVKQNRPQLIPTVVSLFFPHPLQSSVLQSVSPSADFQL